MNLWTFQRFPGWIWAKLAPIYSKRHLQHDSIPFFPIALCFMTFLLKIVRFLDKKVNYIFQASCFFYYFFIFPFSSFLIFLLQWKSSRQFYHGVATCSCRKFFSQFFTQIYEHFCAYFRLYWASHSNLGINGNIFSSSKVADFGQSWWHHKWK